MQLQMQTRQPVWLEQTLILCVNRVCSYQNQLMILEFVSNPLLVVVQTPDE